MCNNIKSFFLTALFLGIIPSVFSQNQNESAGDTAVILEVTKESNVSEVQELTESEEESNDDFDSLFDNAEDTDNPVVTEEVKAGTDYNLQVGSIKLPIEVSGLMNTEFGGAYIRQSEENDATVYFDFKNYIYFTTRPDKYLALKGVLKTAMPKDSSDTEENHLLYLYEMYFDYLMFNRVYITAGKKKSVWGNIRLFTSYYDEKNKATAISNDGNDNVNDAQYTNVLYDSRDYISGILKVPVGNHTFTALAMYNEETANNSPGLKDMSFAASAEFIIFNTSINFFGRRFPLSSGTDSSNYQLPIVGLELKRTVFDFDIYGQTMARILSGSDVKDIFTSKFKDFSSISRIITTVGTYRLWTDFIPNFGFNFEFQNVYRPNPSASEHFFTNRFAFEFGMAKLGPAKDIKVALQWNHNITDKTGFLKTGVIISRVMPHCDWRNGVKYEYGEESTSFNKYKLTIGSYLTISLDY